MTLDLLPFLAKELESLEELEVFEAGPSPLPDTARKHITVVLAGLSTPALTGKTFYDAVFFHHYTINN